MQSTPSRLFTGLRLTGLTLLALLLLGGTPASAATVQHSRVRADALFLFTYDENGCDMTQQFVDVTDTRKSEPVLSYYTISTTDCFGTIVYCYSGSAQPTSYTFSRKLESAHITAIVKLKDCSTGADAGVQELDLTWTAEGSPVRSAFKHRTAIPGQYLNWYRTQGKSVSASVEGTLNSVSASIATNATITHTVFIK